MDIIILGDGGHSKVIQEMISSVKSYTIFAILDNKYSYPYKVNGTIYAPMAYLDILLTKKTKVINAIGHNETRKKMTERLLIDAKQYATIIHSSATISPSATIGPGTVIMPKAVINAGAVIGMYCIINSGSIVEHESLVDSYSHVSPNATLTGNVSLGEGVHLGASATTIPGIKIGRWSVIGAGSTVIEDIPDFCTAVGSPARIVHRHNRKEKMDDKVVMFHDKA